MNLNKWRYLGYKKDDILKYEVYLDENNIVTLKVASLVCSFVGIILSIFYLLVDGTVQKSLVSIFFATVAIIVRFITDGIITKRIGASPKAINILVLFSKLIIGLYASYFSTYGNVEQSGVAIIWVILLILIAFESLPLNNVVTLIPIIILFLSASFKLKLRLDFIYDALHTLIIVIIGLFVSWYKTRIKVEEIMAKAKLYEASTTDMLTKLYNRGKIFEILHKLRKEAVAEKTSLICMVMDLDDFKLYNDYYGHPEGDNLLKKIGLLLNDVSKANNIYCGRIGGEEFLAVWKGTNVDQSVAIAKKIHDDLESKNIIHENSKSRKLVTMSQGLVIANGDRIVEVQTIYKIADNQLYNAKAQGKNCYSIYNLYEEPKIVHGDIDCCEMSLEFQ